MKKIIASFCALVLMACQAQSPLANSSSNSVQKERLKVQKECLTGNSPDSCVRLNLLYQDKQYLSGDDLALIEAAEERNFEKISSIAPKLCPDNPFACEALGAVESNKDNPNPKKVYGYVKQGCDGGSGSACFQAAQYTESAKTRFELYEKSCQFGFWEGGTEPCAYAFYGYQCGIGVGKDIIF